MPHPTPPESRSDGATPDSGRAATRRRHRRVVAAVVLATLLVLGLVTGVGVSRLIGHLDENLTADGAELLLTDRPAKKKVEGPKEPLNVLVMGSDSREGKGNNIDGLTGDGERSDTTILFHLSADREHAYGVSIPRDSMVDRPKCRTKGGRSLPAADYVQWNEAFSLGGASCTMQQFEQLTGIRLDHHVVMDFKGFKNMVDAVDGVKVCIPEDIVDPSHGINLPAGTHTLKGAQALNYVRERYVLGNGSDIGRMKRQQAFIASMANKVISADTLARPTRLVKFLDAATKSLRVDKELQHSTQLARLGLEFRGIGLDDIKFITVPWQVDPQDPNRIVWTADAKKVWRRIIDDLPLSRRLSRGAISADKPHRGSAGSASPSAEPSDTAAEEAAANGLCA